jgi:uncharacterized OsmC-like protein
LTDIKSSIEDAVAYLSEHPNEARYTDSPATATLGGSLRVDVAGSDGERITTDMPGAVGGRAEEPSPGWLFRAAIASCVASTIGMEAARAGVELRSLVVEVDSESDDRGILGIDESTPAGPISTRVRVRVAASQMDREELRQVIELGTMRCPVFDATQRAVEMKLEIEASP